MRSLMLAFLAACSFDTGAGSGSGGDGGGLDAPSGDGPPGDIDAGRIDGSVDCGDLLDFAPSNFGLCEVATVMPPLTLDQNGTYRLDTDTGILTAPDDSTIDLVGVVIPQENAPDIYLIAFSSFTIEPLSFLSARGARVLALLTPGDIQIRGGLLVPAAGSADGAGGDNLAACTDVGRGQPGEEQQNGSGSLSGGSGGGGGGFGTSGGRGAGVDNAQAPDTTDGGVVNGSEMLIPLRGGCAGGRGAVVAVSGGLGGGAGGAVQLVSGGLLHVSGLVSARGGGGLGVIGPSGGGGGGGSGGGILLEANEIDVDGVLAANGGGGAEGGRLNGDSDPGSNGHDDDGDRAAGGALVSFGGDGGRGGALAGPPGEDGSFGISNDSALAGGGGGGGGVGRIHLRAIDNLALGGSLISPAPE